MMGTIYKMSSYSMASQIVNLSVIAILSEKTSNFKMNTEFHFNLANLIESLLNVYNKKMGLLRR